MILFSVHRYFIQIMGKIIDEQYFDLNEGA